VREAPAVSASVGTARELRVRDCSIGTDRELVQRHPRFTGDINHLRRFAELAATPIVSEERGRALAIWREFNTVSADPEEVAKRFAKKANPAVAATRKRAARTSLASPPLRKAASRKVASWTAYRAKRGVDLRGVDFPGLILGTVDLGEVLLDDSNLDGAKLRGACLRGAKLRRVDLGGSLLLGADLRSADLRDANLAGADLRESALDDAILDGTDLRGANLSYASLVRTSIDGARLDGCRVYGVAAWNLVGEPASSSDLVITPPTEPDLLVDKLKLAQFMFLILENAELRDVIDTLTSKSVLLLGRFTPERKATLDALRRALREREFAPVMFDFHKPTSKNMTDTVKLLAQMVRFIIVDLTDPASAPYELGLLMSMGLRTTPLVPIIGLGQAPFAMTADIVQEDWVLDVVRYTDTSDLLSRLNNEVVVPAEGLVKELRRRIAPRFGN
jgi:uncharacterized protein YjbI with pentapeptide repeats